MHWGLKYGLIIGLMAAIPITIYFVSSPPVDRVANAKEAMAQRDFATAQRELESLLQDAPEHREALLLAAQAARRGGDFSAAQRHLEAFQKAGGTREERELEEVLRALQTGDVANAPGLLQFCRNNPDNPAVYLMLEALAQGLLIAPNPMLAVECLDVWLKHSLNAADETQAYVWRGQALEMMGLAPEAATDYRKAIKRTPDHRDARLRLAKFLTRDQPTEALAMLEQLARESPETSEVRLYLAKCQRMLGELTQAETILRELNAEMANDYAYLTEVGALALDQGKPVEAATILRQAVAVAPKRRDANVELLRCLRALRNDDDIRKQEAIVKEIDDDLQRRIAARSNQP